MADTDVIARVYPFNKYEKYAREAIENSSRYLPPKVKLTEPRETHLSRSARESTEPPERNREVNLDELPYLEVRFSDVPRTSAGLVFGTDPTCDVVLSMKGISRRYFALTYKKKFPDGYHRLIVRDLGSTYGTIVTYDKKGDEPRSNFDWIIDGFELPNRTEDIIVQPHEHLKFRVIGAADTEDLLGGLRLKSGPATERNTGAHTPVVKRPILLPMRWIGLGTFGAVSRHWNVSTGEEYAYKRPLGETYDKKYWEKEINIMENISNNPQIQKILLHRDVPRAVRGTYISFEDGARLCEFFDLRTDWIAMLQSDVTGPAFTDGDVSGIERADTEISHTTDIRAVDPAHPNRDTYSGGRNVECLSRRGTGSMVGPPSPDNDNDGRYPWPSAATSDGVGTADLNHNTIGIATVWPWSFHSDILTGTAYVPARLEADDYSQYTESYGTFLGPVSRSYEQLRTDTV
ncbi:hypothetical protein QBC46DRAFT_346060 [Diplogelasinospora grovesii]|uniref:FHA domain-containing protein n=1 Tax=Diplogelasinospora grovesii TaxID=303347 RepID=A0AAN6MYN7_9PEZI|nr:hypothetical protein QBC46DRAFT_346060 [Diplogelasinospora grovesii]